MSDKHRPKADDGSGEGAESGADDEDGEGSAESGEGKCKGREGKSKKISFFRLRKGKKLRYQKGKQKCSCVKPGCLGRSAGGGGGRCCLCLKQPKTLDSSGESPPSDPNSPAFTFDMLRALIEKNDFYSKECNPHLDADG